MAEIKLYDYTETIDDGWGWTYERSYYIGMGNLSSSVVVAQIEAVADNEGITVKINSCGGLVFHGWAIYNALVAAKSRGCKITVRIEGLAASIASIIAMAGDVIIICQAAMLMIHKPTIDPFWYGPMDSEDLKREALALDQIQAVLNSIYVARTGLDTETIDVMINAETYITPAEAITLKFADSIESTIIENVMAENAFNHIFKNADAKIRAYANSTIKINKTMSTQVDVKEALKQNTEALKKSNSVMDSLKKFFALHSKEDDDTTEDVVEETTEEVTDEVVTEEEVVEETQEVKDLKAENLSLRTALTEATNNIKAITETLEGVKNIKSKYVPESREQEIIDKNDKTPKNEGITMDAIKARREERKQLKNK